LFFFFQCSRPFSKPDGHYILNPTRNEPPFFLSAFQFPSEVMAVCPIGAATRVRRAQFTQTNSSSSSLSPPLPDVPPSFRLSHLGDQGPSPSPTHVPRSGPVSRHVSHNFCTSIQSFSFLFSSSDFSLLLGSDVAWAPGYSTRAMAGLPLSPTSLALSPTRYRVFIPVTTTTPELRALSLRR